MVEEKYTRCPGCRTIFRVTPAQLALRDGQVRCGHCRTVFDGVAQLISLAPLPRDESPLDQDALGPMTVTLRNARALEPAPGTAETSSASPRPAPAPPPDVDYENRFAWDKPTRLSPAALAARLTAIGLLTLLLVGQVLYHYRDGLAARWPSLRPLLLALCQPLKCEVRPLHEIAALSIEASDLQADAAHRGLLILTATVRNRAPFQVAYPQLELTLTDARDEVVVRRAIPPAEYLPATAPVDAGIGPNGEVSLKLFVDASATTQAGYRLYLFYP